MTATPTTSDLRKGDWLRFQSTTDGRVLEGFIQEVKADRIRIGHAAATPDAVWYPLKEITVIRHQPR